MSNFYLNPWIVNVEEKKNNIYAYATQWREWVSSRDDEEEVSSVTRTHPRKTMRTSVMADSNHYGFESAILRNLVSQQTVTKSRNKKQKRDIRVQLYIYFMSILLEERPRPLAPSQTSHKKQSLRKIYTDIRTENFWFSVQIYNLHIKKLQKQRIRKMCLQPRHVFGENREQASKGRHFSFSEVLVKLIEPTFNKEKNLIFHVVHKNTEEAREETSSCCVTPSSRPPSFSLKNKRELNTGQPSYCYSTTNLKLADFGKVIRLKTWWELGGFFCFFFFFLRQTLTFPLLS